MSLPFSETPMHAQEIYGWAITLNLNFDHPLYSIRFLLQSYQRNFLAIKLHAKPRTKRFAQNRNKH